MHGGVIMNALRSVCLGVWVLVLAGCGEKLQSASRFRLPQGDVERGKAAFIALDCTKCHTVAGVADLPRPTAQSEDVIVLGGEVVRLRTMGDLLTAIVHPTFISNLQNLKPGSE